MIADTAHSALQNLRRHLVEIDVANEKSYTLKAFRPGMATHMAARGDPFADILRAGDWKSVAFLAYVNESEVDRARFIATCSRRMRQKNRRSCGAPVGSELVGS